MNALLPEARRTLALAGPIIVGQVSQMLMGVTDSIMIGHVGKVPLAASAFANSVWGFGFLIGIGLLTSVAVLVARAHGAGRDAECGEWLRHGTALAVVFSVATTLVLFALGAQLHLFDQPAEVLAVIHPYYELITLSLLPTLLFQVLRQFAESMGRPVGPMLIMLGGVVLNVGLNWVLIYGNLGAPALGLEGAGWATLTARIVSVVAIFLWLKTAPSFRTAWPRPWIGGWMPPRFRELLGLGVPGALSLAFEGGAFSAAAVMMGFIGATELAAHQIAISCAAFTFMFPLGLSMAVSMRVARAIGEGRSAAVRPIGLGAHAMSAITMGTFALLFFWQGEAIAAGFVKETEVIALAARLLLVAGIFQLADGAQAIGMGALRGLSDVKVPTAVMGCAYWLIALPAGYFFGVRGMFGAVGVWAALAIGLAIAAVSLLVRFLRITRAT